MTKHAESHDEDAAPHATKTSHAKEAPVVPVVPVAPVAHPLTETVVDQLREALTSGSDAEKVARVKALLDSLGELPYPSNLKPVDPNADKDPETGNPYH